MSRGNPDCRCPDDSGRRKPVAANLDRLFQLIQRDHGGCDQSSCTLGVALRNGYALVAIDNWIGSGAADGQFYAEAAKGLPYGRADVTAESDLMCREVNHVECPGCNGVIWEPEWCDYACDNCGAQATKPGGAQ